MCMIKPGSITNLTTNDNYHCYSNYINIVLTNLKCIKMKTILVPTDFSKNAENALKYAVTIAQKENAKIILLNAFDILITSPGLVSPEIIMEEIQILEGNSKTQLQSLFKKNIETKKVKCELICKHGFITEVIIDTAERINPDLIIMGTKGASGLKSVIMGSNTARIIEKINYPIIAVPEKAKFNGLKQITYASDYNNSDILVIKKLIEIAKIFNSKLNLVHVTENEDQEEKSFFSKFSNNITNKIKYNNLSFHLIQGANLEKKLNDYLKKSETDLLAMSTQPHNLFDRVFGINIIKKMAYHTDVPLIVYNYSEKLVAEIK